MTIQDVYDKLEEALEKLEEEGIEDDARLDLEILILQLKKQLLIGAFDPLNDLDDVTVADVSSLKKLVAQLDKDISKEKKRVETVNKIVMIAKIGLKAAGLPIPS